MGQPNNTTTGIGETGSLASAGAIDHSATGESNTHGSQGTVGVGPGSPSPAKQVAFGPGVTKASPHVSNLGMKHERSTLDLAEHVRAAATGDKAAARAILDAIEDEVYELALRMLGHPADAEDAAQEILVIVLTHLGSFRGESAFQTWVWRIAANHLARVRRGRREVLTFEVLEDRLRSGLREEPSERPGPETEALANELRLRCTEGMILSLDRELRIAYVLGDILNLSGGEAALVLEIDEAAYRKRLSRARERLYDFLRGWCGVFDDANPCRCAGQVECAVERGLLDARDLYLSKERRRPAPAALHRAADEVTILMDVAEVLRGPSGYLAPDALARSLRELLDSRQLELLRR
jgi:RNA polymerase sigma factor (sigma-70 family)